MEEYLKGYDDALKSVPIVSAEYAALEKERDELKARVTELEKGFKAALRWLKHSIVDDVFAQTMPPAEAGFTGGYLNDLADIRKARSLMESKS